jgi:hypothetical protein
VFVEPDNQFGGDEAGCHIAPDDLHGLLCKLRLKAGRPQSVAEQLGDLPVLGVMLMLGDRPTLNRFAVEIATQHESNIGLDIVPVETEESMFGLEVTNLQNAIDLGMASGTAGGERQLGFGQYQVLQPLGIIEVRQAIQSVLLSFR